MKGANVDMMKVKTVLEAYNRLNVDEQGAFLVLVTTLNELQVANKLPPKSVASSELTAKVVHKPDPRGKYSCPICKKVLPTKRGRSIHAVSAHKETAAQGGK